MTQTASAAQVHTDTAAARRGRGAFFTPQLAANLMADWALRRAGDRVLEPSFGDGIFLAAMADAAARRGLAGVVTCGVELDPATAARGRARGLADDVRCGDFLDVAPFPVDAVVGNPPYVRLRRLGSDARRLALDAAAAALGRPIDPSGSLWMPFVLHAMRFLAPGGRLAFVLPYELTYVRYARPLWRALADGFGSLRVVRTRRRLFPELMQDVVLLLADGRGGTTGTVGYQACDGVADLLEGRPVVDERLDVDAVVGGDRPFVRAMLAPELRQLLDGRVAAATVPGRRRVRFHIGYVTGDKAFFHPTDERCREHRLPAGSLRPAVASARAISGAGLRTSGVRSTDRLFLPTGPRSLTAGERRYVAAGEAAGVDRRYKCRARQPWYLVPGVRVPDVLVGVFTERPVLLVNDAAVVASNSLLCGYAAAGVAPEQIAVGWYTSLTLLQCELEVHALGGGVMVLVPGEAGRLRLPAQVRADADHLALLDRTLRSGQPADAYRAGDDAVLVRQLGLTPADMRLIRDGIETLARWRRGPRGDAPATPDADPRRVAGG
jgi:adenine-specific DNA-methyltransferase